MSISRTRILIFITVFAFVCAAAAQGQEFSSAHYTALDPVITSGGGYATSANYALTSSLGQLVAGTSSASSFAANFGFLYFPYASSPVVSATPGDGQISLSWTASNGALGWTPASYQVGQATVSGGPYSYSSVGNVTSATIPSLANGTTYYFVVRALDTFGNVIAVSGETSATPAASVTPPPPGPGGSSGPPPPAPTGVSFSGRAYPLSTVDILEDGQLVATTIADPKADFSVSIGDLASGNYTFSVYGEDQNGRRSSSFTFHVFITAGVMTNIGGIFLAPTIAVDKSEVKQGDNIAIFGQSTPNAAITISVHSTPEYFETTQADGDGVYLYNFDTAPLSLDTHLTKSKAATSTEISPFSGTVSFIVGDKTVLASSTCPVKGDLNGDCRVDLVDFSIAAYWYKKPLSDAFKAIEAAELGGFGIVDLRDFSIMAYYWTG